MTALSSIPFTQKIVLFILLQNLDGCEVTLQITTGNHTKHACW